MRLLAVALVLAAPAALAQVCCVGGGAYAPARLLVHEDAAAGLQLRALDANGSLNGAGAYVPQPSGVGDYEFEERVIGNIRLFQRAQVGASVPIAQTLRSAQGLSESGGGLGDIAIAGRYDFVYSAESDRLPGIAVTFGAVTPTGRAPEDARLPLGSDATGTGALQGNVGANVEQLFGQWVLSGSLSLGASAPRTVGSVTEQLGPQLSLFLAAGYVINDMTAAALTLSSAQSLDAVIDGQRVPSSARGLTTVALTLGRETEGPVRMQGALSYDLPWLGRNRVAGVALSVIFLWTWS